MRSPTKYQCVLLSETDAINNFDSDEEDTIGTNGHVSSISNGQHRSEPNSPKKLSKGDLNLSSSQKKAATIYRSCIDTKSLANLKLTPLKTFLDSIGGWDILEVSDSVRDFNSSWSLLENLLKIHGKVLYPLFRVAVDVDARNTSRHIFSIHQPVLTFPALVHYMNLSTGDAVTNIPQSTLRYLLAAINVTAGALGAKDMKRVQKEAENMAIFEAKLAMTMYRAAEQKNKSQFHSITTLEILNSTAPFIEWAEFIKGLLGEKSSVELKPSEPVTFGDSASLTWLSLLNKLIQNYTSTPSKRRTLDNYLKWRAVIVLLGFVDGGQFDDNDPTGIIKSFTQQNHPRWILCMLRTTEVMGMPLASLFLQLNPLAKIAKQMVESLANNIIEAMKQEILEIDWMDEDTKNTALSKVHETLALVSYSEEMLDVSRLDQEFKEVMFQVLDYT